MLAQQDDKHIAEKLCSMKHQINEDFSRYRDHYQNYDFSDASSFGPDYSGRDVYHQIAEGIAQSSDLTAPYYDKVGGGLKQRIKSCLKNLIRRYSRPFVNITMVHQKEINQLNVLLAQTIVSLEHRVAILEKHINKSI